MRRLPLTDAGFLINETRRTPMHVGGVHLFDLPEGADDVDFLAELSQVLRYDEDLRHPFGERLKLGPLGVLGPMVALSTLIVGVNLTADALAKSLGLDRAQRAVV